jgi:hypothetical protein
MNDLRQGLLHPDQIDLGQIALKHRELQMCAEPLHGLEDAPQAFWVRNIVGHEIVASQGVTA